MVLRFVYAIVYYMEQSIGQRIRAHRKARHMTASQLAGRVGLTENAVRKLESGDSKEPRFTTGLRIAHELGLPPEALAGHRVSTILSPPELAAVIRGIRKNREKLNERGVAHVQIFGSVARGEARADSDIDLVVEPETGAHFSLMDLADAEIMLEEALGRKVDILTTKTLERASFANKAFGEAVRVF
jgi:uncharacterized protein